MSRKPPAPDQRRYSGTPRADMQSAYNHLYFLWAWDAKYISTGWGDLGVYYPSQLYDAATRDTINKCISALSGLLKALGPIPALPYVPGGTPPLTSIPSSRSDALIDPLTAFRKGRRQARASTYAAPPVVATPAVIAVPATPAPTPQLAPRPVSSRLPVPVPSP